jgi:hypothetical protein
MSGVEIDWDSVHIHRGTLKVLLKGEWAHDAAWAALFNRDLPAVFNTSWGQISSRSPTFGAWDQIVARDNGVITVHALTPGHATELRTTLEAHVADANRKMANVATSRRRVEQLDPDKERELDARDQAMTEEFRQLSRNR